MASGLASSYPQLLVFRMFSGMAGVAPMTSAYGVYADLEADITARGRLCANLVTASQSAPIFGAFIGGFIAIPGWRWCCWFCLICAGITLPMSIFMPETFAPIILKRRAELLRKTTGKMNIVAPIELSHQGFKDKVTSNFSRPFHMLFTEPIVYCSAIFLSLTYAMGFVYLQAYPLIFTGIYGLDSAYTGICFLPIFVGIAIAHVLFIWYENFLTNAKARNASWVNIEEYRRLPLACLGGPSYVVALFWISWTARSSIHWSVPALSGISFGIGWNINFQTLTNYVNDAYGIYSASANAAVTSCRCLFGAVLPLAVKPMFDHLGVNWGCSLLAFVSLAVSVVPFVFIYCGTRIRANSKFCRELQKLQEHKMKEASSDSEAGVAVIDSRPKDVEKQDYR
ncbi:MFS multidrug transporter [Aspergillus terreus]|uniref:MFS multidrug transporter n=1 Tax=Aspergillus terreus TaxID=33178 RepID=A0A5M3YWQ1_ASPTE|nr:hypothetical protein ATETN484_0003077000 [Aspergillus terreus]GFF14756.1 MFS multidrug transporter [Aspergillus terreus]